MLLALQSLALLRQGTYPSIFAGLLPAIADGDETDVPALTNLSTAITYYDSAGRYDTAAGGGEYGSDVKIQRTATGDWHPWASPPGYKFWINGQVRPLSAIGALQADAIAAWETIGYTVILAEGTGGPVGTVTSQLYSGVEVGAYDLLPLAGTVTLAIATVVPVWLFGSSNVILGA